jgi:hypothetical protein
MVGALSVGRESRRDQRLFFLGLAGPKDKVRKRAGWANNEDAPMRIELREHFDWLRGELRRSLLWFRSRWPDEISTVGLFGDGFHGTGSLHLDTPKQSAKLLQKMRRKYGVTELGRDEAGDYSNACWDFRHCVLEFTFPGYPNLYEAGDEIVEFAVLDGAITIVRREEGNEELNGAMFPFLKAVLKSLEPFAELRRIEPFRAGVEMHDSSFREFWRLAI